MNQTGSVIPGERPTSSRPRVDDQTTDDHSAITRTHLDKPVGEAGDHRDCIWFWFCMVTVRAPILLPFPLTAVGTARPRVQETLTSPSSAPCPAVPWTWPPGKGCRKEAQMSVNEELRGLQDVTAAVATQQSPGGPFPCGYSPISELLVVGEGAKNDAENRVLITFKAREVHSVPIEVIEGYRMNE